MNPGLIPIPAILLALAMDRPPSHPNDGIDPAIRAATEYAPPFSSAHLAAVVASAAAVIAVIWTARRCRASSPSLADPAGKVLGSLAIVHWVAYQAWWNIPARFDLSSSLPLHICDLAGLASGMALLTGKRWLAVLTYFWGLSLCTQAFVTPTVGWGPTYTEYWLFWESHTVAVGGALYLVFVRDFRPSFRDLVFAYLALVGYAAVVIPLDLLAGWNYGYIGRSSPSSATIIDALGPWPWRLLPMAGLAAFSMLIVRVPWLLVPRCRAAETAGVR